MKSNVAVVGAGGGSGNVTPVDWLFGELLGMFGKKFTDQWSNVIDGVDVGMVNAKAVWAEKIRSNGLKVGDVRRGLAGCERLKWPPSWGEFLELCSPSIDFDAALDEAVRQTEARKLHSDKWTNPAIYWAAVQVGQFNILSKPWDWLRPRFEKALTKIIEAGNVQPVPETDNPALPAPGESFTDCETGKRNIAEVATNIKVGFGKPGLMWAHRAIERAANGLPVAEAVLRDARAALKVGEQ